MNLNGLGLPLEVTSRVELSAFEDIMLTILRRDFPSIPCFSLIPPDVTYPFIWVSRRAPLEVWGGHPRFTDRGRVIVSVFAEEPDGIEKAQYVSEAIRVSLRDAWLRHEFFPGLGSIVNLELKSEPTRSPDWATSAGPVQFADLPNNIHRFEAMYTMTVRRPRY